MFYKESPIEEKVADFLREPFNPEKLFGECFFMKYDQLNNYMPQR